MVHGGVRVVVTATTVGLSAESEKTVKRDSNYLYLGWMIMLDGVSLDQLRAFIATVDEGSFSAAGRKLYRVQSALSGLRAEQPVGLMKNRLQICLRGPYFRRFLADRTTIGRRTVENLSSRRQIFAFDSISPTGC
jgi:hypothetical protein